MTQSKPQNSTTQSSISFGGLLTILFIALKLTGYINWSWLWVLSPLWIPFFIAISVILVAFVTIAIVDRPRK